MPLTTLGKRVHKVKRFSKGGYVNGRWVEGTTEIVDVYANIQPASQSYQARMLPEGEREKEAIAISSDHWLYSANSSDAELQADLIQYRGAEWKVVVYRPCGNFGTHCEGLAVKFNDDPIERITGVVGVIN